MWPRIVAGIFIPVGNHYFQALASTLQFVAQVCDRLWLVPATDRAFAYITYMSPPHVALVCSGPPQSAATCGWTKWPVCSGLYRLLANGTDFMNPLSNSCSIFSTALVKRWGIFDSCHKGLFSITILTLLIANTRRVCMNLVAPCYKSMFIHNRQLQLCWCMQNVCTM